MSLKYTLTKTSFFKINLAGKGYSLYWPDNDQLLSLQQVDQSLPNINTFTSSSKIAYSASLLNKLNGQITNKMLLLSICLYFPQLKDEYKRKGLFYTHCNIIYFNTIDIQLIHNSSSFLKNLYNFYAINYIEVEKLCSKLSLIKDFSLKRSFKKLVEVTFDQNTTLEDSFINNFYINSNFFNLNANLNIKVSFPLHENLVIYALVYFLLTNNTINNIAGGNISNENISKYELISCIDDFQVFKKVDITNYFFNKTKARNKFKQLIFLLIPFSVLGFLSFLWFIYFVLYMKYFFKF